MEQLLVELVNRQNSIDAMNVESDAAASEITVEIKKLEAKLSEMKELERRIRKPYEDEIKLFNYSQYENKQRVLEMWDGKKKTLKFDIGALKFRTTTSVNIEDEPALLENLMDHLSTPEEIMEYITGFSKTAVKKYMSVHKMDKKIVELIPKTGVSFVVNE